MNTKRKTAPLKYRPSTVSFPKFPPSLNKIHQKTKLYSVWHCMYTIYTLLISSTHTWQTCVSCSCTHWYTQVIIGTYCKPVLLIQWGNNTCSSFSTGKQKVIEMKVQEIEIKVSPHYSVWKSPVYCSHFHVYSSVTQSMRGRSLGTETMYLHTNDQLPDQTPLTHQYSLHQS